MVACTTRCRLMGQRKILNCFDTLVRSHWSDCLCRLDVALNERPRWVVFVTKRSRWTAIGTRREKYSDLIADLRLCLRVEIGKEGIEKQR